MKQVHNQPDLLNQFIEGLCATPNTYPQSHFIPSSHVLVNLFLFNYTMSFTLPIPSTRSAFAGLVNRRYQQRVKDKKAVFFNINNEARAITWRFNITTTPTQVVAFIETLIEILPRKADPQITEQLMVFLDLCKDYQRHGVKTINLLKSDGTDGSPLGSTEGLHTTAITFVDDHHTPMERYRVIYSSDNNQVAKNLAIKLFLAVGDETRKVSPLEGLNHFHIHLKHKEVIHKALAEYGVFLSLIPPYGKPYLIPKGSAIFGKLIHQKRIDKLTFIPNPLNQYRRN